MAPPLCLLGLTDATFAQALCQKMKTMFAALVRLMQDSSKFMPCKNFIKNLDFPQEEWTMTQLTRLAETEFEAVPPLVNVAIHEFSDSFLSTLYCEHTFNAVRKVIRRTPSCNIGGEGIWHRTLTQKFGDGDRKICSVTREGRAAAATSLPKSMFTVAKNDCTIPEEDMQKIHNEKPHWCTMKGNNMRSKGFRFLVAVSMNGVWASIRMSWLSVFLPKGCVCEDTSDPNARVLILRASASGYIGWRVHGLRRAATEGGPITFGEPGEDSVAYGAVKDLHDWRCVGVEATSPNDPCVRRDAETHHLVVTSRAQPVLTYQALHGFRGIPLTYLKRLYSHLQCKRPKGESCPSTATQYVSALIKHIVGDEHATEQLIAGAHAAREADELQVHDSLLLTPEWYQLVQEDIDDDQETAEDVAELRRRYEKSKVGPPIPCGTPGAASSSSTGAVPLAAVAAPAGSRMRKKIVVFEGRGLSQSEAKTYVPPGYTISKIKVRDCAWQVKGEHGFSRYRAFDASGGAAKDRWLAWTGDAKVKQAVV